MFDRDSVIKIAINYAVKEAPATKIWWICKNIQALLEEKEVDPKFLEMFTTNKT